MRETEGQFASPEKKSGDFVLSSAQEDRGTVEGYEGLPYRLAAYGAKDRVHIGD